MSERDTCDCLGFHECGVCDCLGFNFARSGSDCTQSDDSMDAPAFDDPDAPTLGEVIDRAENARDAAEDR